MTAIHILTPSLFAIALVSCAPQKTNQYDTANPYDTPAASQTTPPVTAPANPVYDTPAAYEENTGTTPAQDIPATPATAASPAPAAHGAAIIHTVVKGDTLSGISAKYKIPAASIRQANRMTSDTVVLDRKMVIPPR